MLLIGVGGMLKEDVGSYGPAAKAVLYVIAPAVMYGDALTVL